VPAPIITASKRLRSPTSISVSVSEPIGPERPSIVARPSRVTTKFIARKGRSSRVCSQGR
jgi:hypothetical protein